MTWDDIYEEYNSPTNNFEVVNEEEEDGYSLLYGVYSVEEFREYLKEYYYPPKKKENKGGN